MLKAVSNTFKFCKENCFFHVAIFTISLFKFKYAITGMHIVNAGYLLTGAIFYKWLPSAEVCYCIQVRYLTVYAGTDADCSQ